MILQDYFQPATTSALALSNAVYGSQSFTANSSYAIQAVTLLLSGDGSVGNVTVSITDATPQNNTGLPTGADLISVSQNGDSIPGTATQVLFTFASTYSLTSGHVYCIVVKSGSATLNWYEQTSDGYAGGRRGRWAGSWAGAARDLWFETYSPDAGTTYHFTGAITGTSSFTGTLTKYVFKKVSGSIVSTSTFAGTVRLVYLTFIYPRPRTADVAGLDWSDATDTWAADLAIQGAGGGRYLITAIAFSLDADTNGTIFLGS